MNKYRQLEGLQLRKKGYYSTTLDDSESRAGLHHFELASLCNLIQDVSLNILRVFILVYNYYIF